MIVALTGLERGRARAAQFSVAATTLMVLHSIPSLAHDRFNPCFGSSVVAGRGRHDPGKNAGAARYEVHPPAWASAVLAVQPRAPGPPDEQLRPARDRRCVRFIGFTPPRSAR